MAQALKEIFNVRSPLPGDNHIDLWIDPKTPEGDETNKGGAPKMRTKEEQEDYIRTGAKWQESQHTRDESGQFASSDRPRMRTREEREKEKKEKEQSWPPEQAERVKTSTKTTFKPVTREGNRVLAHGEAPDWLLAQPISTVEMEQAGGRTAAIERRKKMGTPPMYDAQGFPFFPSEEHPTADKGAPPEFGKAFTYSKQGDLFDEAKHPRDNDGKFSESGGGGSPAKPKAAARPPLTKAQIAQAKKNSKVKYNRVARLEAKREYLLGRTQRDIRSRDKEKADAAAVMWLILNTGMRPGYRGATAEVPSYGASTLLAKHVDANGNTVLKFKGKKQVDQAVEITDKRLAEFLKIRSREVSKKSGDDSPLFSVRESQLLKYAKNITGGKRYKVKDFRTMKGTMEARKIISSLPTPTTNKEYKKSIKEVATHVARQLGNTPAICLQAYIDPSVFGEWKNAAGI